MASGGARVAFTEADRARVLTTLAANGGNVKKTAHECGVSPASIRGWRAKAARGAGPSQALIAVAVGEFVDDAERVRNKALMLLEARINAGEIKTSELITATGVLDDKVRLAKGLATSKVEHSSAFPPAEELQAILSGVVAGAIVAAERRDAEIVDAEIVELPELPVAT